MLCAQALGLGRHCFFREADVVHLQMIHAAPFLSLLQLPALARAKPLVLTLHECWPITGHCCYPLECERWLTGCGQCPDLSRPIPAKRDAARLSFQLKRWAMQKARPELVIASRWMERLAARSPVMQGLESHRIPFGIDLSCFKPRGKAERENTDRDRQNHQPECRSAGRSGP